MTGSGQTMKQKILVVDDESTNLKLLREILKDDYTLAFAKDGATALKLVKTDLPDLILLDIMMPDMDGFEVCRKLKEDERSKDVLIIFITALNDEVDEIEGFQLGAADYINKPVKSSVVKARIKTHLSLMEARRELKKHNEVLEQTVLERTEELCATQREIVHRLGLAAEYRDPDTGDHIQRMSHYSAMLARALGWNEEEVHLLQLASPMHDIGKLGIPDRILLKPAKLDSDEWEIMRSHTVIGGVILKEGKSNILKIAQEIALSHHERWDGTGYPHQLSGEAISKWGRCAAIADVFDALTARRPYKNPWTIEKATEAIVKESGTHFDPTMVKSFKKIIPHVQKIMDQFPE